MTKDQFCCFYSDTMETCSNMKFNTKLLDPEEALVQYNPGVIQRSQAFQQHDPPSLSRVIKVLGQSYKT